MGWLGVREGKRKIETRKKKKKKKKKKSQIIIIIIIIIIIKYLRKTSIWRSLVVN
ncbi:unnamed protein product, partial [Vitis vinifera]|uniref:Uncharacterized protein n=1 Tax=Vitis vinifera TaxID=29760 RepID=D7SRH6_VITVI